MLEWRSGGVSVGASEFGVRSCECGTGDGGARAELINAVPAGRFAQAELFGRAATPPYQPWICARARAGTGRRSGLGAGTRLKFAETRAIRVTILCRIRHDA
jgi:hypothetical protein